MSHIARQTLGFYKESATPEDVDMSEAVEQVLEVYARKIGAKEIAVDKDLDRDVRVRGSKGELRQVMSNVILNAVDAVPRQGRIVIRVRRRYDTAQFSVTDNGSGIAREDRAKIFQPFFTTKRDVGTGLGLWVSKGIVEKHGGRVLVRSRMDAACSGTMFLVKLPAAEVGRTVEAGHRP